MPPRISSGLYDPRRGDHAIRVDAVNLGCKSFEPVRTNYFCVYRITNGRGTFWADASQFAFGPSDLLFLVPYQHIRFAPETAVRGDLLQFHANFLCVETFHAEVGCAGILFNDPYRPPVLTLDEASQLAVGGLIERMRSEQAEQDLAFDEVMLANLKVLLILATRLKTRTGAACPPGGDSRHPVVAELRELIEQHYRTLHSPADYADRLHVTAKTLGRIVREQLGTTPTDLIKSRILIHAKWQLLHTLKPVKEIAREVGFHDELYFSHLFKKGTGVSPTFFREFETEIRGGSNLSMLSDDAPILAATPAADT
ncbi:MAG TPA: AraC family transcriptional regulator [Planctomycetaceae bacterium]|nr:AraC family transcriptional regulator [Planctomycetaceae bacterium]